MIRRPYTGSNAIFIHFLTSKFLPFPFSGKFDLIPMKKQSCVGVEISSKAHSRWYLARNLLVREAIHIFEISQGGCCLMISQETYLW